MQYTLILTETAEGGIQVTIPALPACRVEAWTRDDAIRLAREAIAQLVSRSEVVQVDIPEQPRTTGMPHETPWGRLSPTPGSSAPTSREAVSVGLVPTGSASPPRPVRDRA
jgi:predicted RNase H-like HicB family nuclease